MHMLISLETFLTICVKTSVMKYGVCISKVATGQVTVRKKSGNFILSQGNLICVKESQRKLKYS